VGRVCNPSGAGGPDAGLQNVPTGPVPPSALASQFHGHKGRVRKNVFSQFHFDRPHGEPFKRGLRDFLRQCFEQTPGPLRRKFLHRFGDDEVIDRILDSVLEIGGNRAAVPA
jgi:hypothetical protein